MLSCANCGGANEDAARFCVHCGARLGASAPPAARKPSRKPSRKKKKKKRQGTLIGTPLHPGAPAAHSMSEALEGALAAAGGSPAASPQPPPAHQRPALPPDAEFQPVAIPVELAPSPEPPPVLAPEPAPETLASPVPPPPEAPPDGLHLEQVLAGIDDGFDAIADGRGPAQDADAYAADMAEPRALFEQIAAQHMRPVRDFLVELRMVEPPRDWIQLCLPAMTSLRNSASGIGLTSLCQAIDGFLPSLQHVADSNENYVAGPARDAILAAYGPLEQQLPGVFALDEERDRREPIIVQSLLSQVDGVRAVALDKIYAAGLTNLAMFYAAKPEDIAAATGLALDLSARIVQRFTEYKTQAVDVTPDAERSVEQDQLATLLTALKEQNDAFQSAADGGSTHDKRRLRRERANTMLKVNVMLARLGEIERLQQLERLPFERKVDELEETLKALKSRHAAPA